MVIKIHQACSTKNALFYNERKVERQKACFYHSQNLPVVNPFLGDKNDRYKIFQEIEDRNTRVKKPGLHISVNPTVSDLVLLGDAGIRNEIGKLMEHLGYGNQPYLVYKHADLERVHFHIVSTRIDCDTGKKIKDSYEKEKTQRFIKSLEQKYGLSKDDQPEKLNYRFSSSSRNLKQNLESLFSQLNRMEFITSKELYEQALELFQVEIRRAGRGHLVFVTDENGNPIRYPVRMSDFEERPRFFSGQTYRHAPVENRYREPRLPDHFKRELLKALVYQLEESSTRRDQAGRKRKNKIGRKKGKRH
ncbi:relaxase/mobilization nuclease domain-containing protein [uncultured Sunxiuqinia sp.]|uniref:relaxase/mobilization nuclease domain-containing protein n=1 Tax=uncultured Sunxiuqinia sp. TaxID=1573825 RepID=UPI00262397AD|nr:relaxase/mobilization nuclease domain-containing protein [uncultured Sunxiuqinia sp.]